MKNWAAKNLPFEKDTWQPLSGAAQTGRRCPICCQPVPFEPTEFGKKHRCPHCDSGIQFEYVPRFAPEQKQTSDEWQASYSWLREFTNLCKSDVPQAKLFAELVEGLGKAIYAVAVVVWSWNGRRLNPDYEVGFQWTGVNENSKDRRKHIGLVKQVLAAGQTKTVRPAGSNNENPSGWALMFVPLKHDETTKAILEIFYWPDRLTTLQQLYCSIIKQTATRVCQSETFRSFRPVGRKSWWMLWRRS
jgi:hypothetical protein